MLQYANFTSPNKLSYVLLETLFFLGALCTCCTADRKQINDPEYAEKHWYPQNRSRDQNLALYHSLKKKPDGSIDTTVASKKRLGMTIKPMGSFLSWIGKTKFYAGHLLSIINIIMLLACL